MFKSGSQWVSYMWITIPGPIGKLDNSFSLSVTGCCLHVYLAAKVRPLLAVCSRQRRPAVAILHKSNPILLDALDLFGVQANTAVHKDWYQNAVMRSLRISLVKEFTLLFYFILNSVGVMSLLGVEYSGTNSYRRSL